MKYENKAIEVLGEKTSISIRLFIFVEIVVVMNMDTKPIYNYLRELSRCEYQPSVDAQPLELFKYNGISYAQSSATYQMQLEKELAEFKASIIALIPSVDNSVIRAILTDCIGIENQYYDIPDSDTIEAMERDYVSGRNVSLLKSIREAKFLNEMVGLQRYYISEVKTFLTSLCGNDNPKLENQKEPKENDEVVRKDVDSDWLTLDEVCSKFKLPRNNIKDRQWRLKNKFPLGNSAPYKNLTFNVKDVEAWLKGKC